MKTDFFFVYGTLKIGGVYAKHFDKFRVSSKSATINNMNLYKIGYFPGVIPGNGVVVGELHEYKNPEIVTTYMDQIEGYDGSKQSLFRREYRTVVTKSGKKVKANVYIYNYKASCTKQINNGIWVNT